jgi:hypothetical protein
MVAARKLDKRTVHFINKKFMSERTTLGIVNKIELHYNTYKELRLNSKKDLKKEKKVCNTKAMKLLEKIFEEFEERKNLKNRKERIIERIIEKNSEDKKLVEQNPNDKEDSY